VTTYLAVLGVAAALAAVLVVGLRRSWPSWLLLVAALVPAVLLYLSNEHLRVYSTHGFVHTGIVYQILNAGVPPESALFGAVSLPYFWAHHLVVAGLVAALGIHPSTAFAALNVLALGLTLTLLYRAGMLLWERRDAALASAALAVFGVTVTNYGPVKRLAGSLTGFDIFGVRNPPVSGKFTNQQSMGFGGYLFFSLGLYALLRIASRGERPLVAHLALALAFLGTGYFYPIACLALAAAAAVVGAVDLLRNGLAAFRVWIPPALASLGAGLLLVPYALQTTGGKGRSPMALLPDPIFALQKSLWWALTFSIVALLVWWQWGSIERAWRERRDAAAALLSVLAALSLLYITVSTEWVSYTIPGKLMQIEYKFLGLFCLSLGLVGGGALASLIRAKVWLGGLVATLLFASASADIVSKARDSSHRLLDPYTIEGANTIHADPAEAALYRWIREETGVDVLFLDTRLTIPMFGRRQLYVAYDLPRADAPRNSRDGYHESVPDMLMGWFGHSEEEVAERTALVAGVFAEDGAISAGQLAALREAAADRSLYAVARSAAEANRLAGTRAFELVFASGSASVYRLAAAPGPVR
jgi:hypothetical protein